MKKQIFTLSLIFAFLLSSFASAFSPDERVIVKFPEIKLNKGERIVGYDLVVTNGQIVGVTKIAFDWSVDVEAEMSGETKSSGSCTHGAGALYGSADLPQFTIIVDGPIEDSLKFRVKGKIQATADFESIREIDIAPEKMVIKSGI